MKNYKALILPTLSLTLFFCVAAQSNCHSKNKLKTNIPNVKNQNMNTNYKTDEPMTKPGGELKIIAEGAYSQIETPFVFVARTGETYTQMQNLVEKLPPASEINFDKYAVVAAFAGTRNTGGFSVAIKKSAGDITVEVLPPPKDAMTTQALTMPYQVALVPVTDENAPSLNIPADWQNAAQTYKVASSNFEFSGGITGRGESFSAAGTIKMLRFDENVTLIFNLSGDDAKKARRLTETASGKISDGKIDIARLDAGSFSENPKPPLKVAGTIAGDKLNLDFEPLPTIVADGFQVRGKIEAVRYK